MKDLTVGRIGIRRNWGCPLTKNRSSWCHAWCDPMGGIGACGRVAPHGMVGRTQRAIQRFNERKSAGNAS